MKFGDAILNPEKARDCFTCGPYSNLQQVTGARRRTQTDFKKSLLVDTHELKFATNGSKGAWFLWAHLRKL